MVNRIFFLTAIIGIFLFNSMIYTPYNEEKQTNTILFANPLIFKALSGPLHNLLADKLWLLSNSVSEMGLGGTYSVNSEEFVAASKTIVMMDPYFYAPVNYASTFMVSIKKDMKSSLELLRLSRTFDRYNFKLYFNELVFLLTYGEDYNYSVDYEYVVDLAKMTESLPIEDKQIGMIFVGNWIDDFIISANNKMNRHAQAIDDLKWLYDNSDNQERRYEIQKRINELKQQLK